MSFLKHFTTDELKKEVERRERGLSKREAMDVLLSGGDVDYYYESGLLGNYSPLSWDEYKGVKNSEDYATNINWYRLKEKVK